MKNRKTYMIPETAFELFLEPQSKIMSESKFGHKDGTGNEGPFSVPSRQLYL